MDASMVFAVAALLGVLAGVSWIVGLVQGARAPRAGLLLRSRRASLVRSREGKRAALVLLVAAAVLGAGGLVVARPDPTSPVAAPIVLIHETINVSPDTDEREGGETNEEEDPPNEEEGTPNEEFQAVDTDDGGGPEGEPRARQRGQGGADAGSQDQDQGSERDESHDRDEHGSPPAAPLVLTETQERLPTFGPACATPNSEMAQRLKKIAGEIGDLASRGELGHVLVIGGHDHVPLGPLGRARFGTNAMLAQARAEAVGRVLENSVREGGDILFLPLAVPARHPPCTGDGTCRKPEEHGDDRRVRILLARQPPDSSGSASPSDTQAATARR